MKKYDSIIYFSSIPWNYSFHRQQDMMTYFASKGYGILFVEPPRVQGLAMLKGSRLSDGGKNIHVLSYGGLRFERCLYSIERINQLLCKFAVLQALKRLNLLKPLVWFDRIHGVNCDWFMERYPSVYDLVDEITAFGRWNNSGMLMKKERKVMSRVDFRITSSCTLAARKQRYCSGEEIYFCPNGVDCSRFVTDSYETRTVTDGNSAPVYPADQPVWSADERSPKSVARHPLIAGISRPIVGFVGTISRRSIHTELLIEVAAQNPHMQFVLVGPNDDEDFINQLTELSNIHCFGRVDSNQISSIIACFDVGMIPYVTATPDMDYVFPRKVFEYLASGIPVVTTPLPELTFMDEILYVACDAGDFSKALQAALEQSYNPTVKDKLRNAAQQYDWNVLLNGLEAYLCIN